jgi:hypothetical protein
MTDNDVPPNMMPEHSDVSFPEIPGVVDGRMTVHQEVGGSVSLRVVVGACGQMSARGLLELIIGAEHAVSLTGGPTQLGAGLMGGAGPMSFPCQIGCCPDAAATVA